MQVTLQSGKYVSTIKEERIQRVGQAGARQGAEGPGTPDVSDPALDMGLRDCISDRLNGGVRRKAFSKIFGLTFQAGTLHKELSKPDSPDQNKKIGQATTDLSLYKAQLSSLIPRTHIDIGSKTNLSEIGKEPVLLVREGYETQAILLPVTSVATGEDTESEEVSTDPIPSFASIAEIRQTDLVNLERHGKVRYAGKIYRLRPYDNRLVVLAEEFDPKSNELQAKLSILMRIENVTRTITALGQMDIRVDHRMTIPPLLTETELLTQPSEALLDFSEEYDIVSRAAVSEIKKFSVRALNALEFQRTSEIKLLTKLLEAVPGFTDIPDRLDDAPRILNTLRTGCRSFRDQLDEFKDLYKQAFSLVRQSRSPLIQRLLLARIGKFTHALQNKNMISDKDKITPDAIKIKSEFRKIFAALHSLVDGFTPDLLREAEQLTAHMPSKINSSFESDTPEDNFIVAIINPANRWDKLNEAIAQLRALRQPPPAPPTVLVGAPS